MSWRVGAPQKLTWLQFFKTWCKRHGDQDPRTWDLSTLEPETWDPPQSLKVGPGTPLKFKSGSSGSNSKFKSGILVIIFLHCLPYFILDKYINNMEIIFHE